jgi:glycosyltransferase involved in cell wall biosynthesis
MLIGIDASRAQKPNKTGVEWYSYHLIQELKKITAGGPHQWVLYSREALTGSLAELPENWYEVRAKWPPKWLWTQVRMSWEMWRRPVDVLFVPAHVLPPMRPEKSVVTIHDVGFRRFPNLYTKADRSYHQNTTRRITNGDARVITVSEFSGRELAELYSINTRRIAVTPLGVDHTLYRPITDRAVVEDVLHKYRLPPSFFLAIGRLEAKKNTVNLIRAFEIFKHRRGVGDPTHLVLAGIPGSGYEDVKKAIAASPQKQYIKEIGYIEEEEKPALLSAARALVNISWYEGFGIPAVEAMACGCPVIASNNASLPEVIGEGNGLFVHPKDVDATARAMDRLIADRELRESLVQKGPQVAEKYTWRRTAEATIPVLTDWIGAQKK